MNAHIRWAIRRDVQEILGIEQGSFPTPWEEEDLLNFLRNRNNIGMVAEIGEKVVGFMAYSLQKEYLEIARLCVHPDHRGLGVGTAMVEKLFKKLNPERRSYLAVDVPEEITRTHLWLQKNGFFGLPSSDNSYRFLKWLPCQEEEDEKTNLVLIAE